ncbi:E3 ubiquitin-protein ligase [Sesbania bispinosa]|nr:E3 ubiquitin-protein ligase [Sesbania bispinosa]
MAHSLYDTNSRHWSSLVLKVLTLKAQSNKQLPCDNRRPLHACKLKPFPFETLTCRTCITPWHAPCPPIPPSSILDWDCPDCSQPETDHVVAPALSAGDLVSAIRAIQSNTSLTEKEKAKKRQDLAGGSTKAPAETNNTVNNRLLDILDGTVSFDLYAWQDIWHSFLLIILDLSLLRITVVFLLGTHKRTGWNVDNGVLIFLMLLALLARVLTVLSLWSFLMRTMMDSDMFFTFILHHHGKFKRDGDEMLTYADVEIDVWENIDPDRLCPCKIAPSEKSLSSSGVGRKTHNEVGSGDGNEKAQDSLYRPPSPPIEEFENVPNERSKGRVDRKWMEGLAANPTLKRNINVRARVEGRKKTKKKANEEHERGRERLGEDSDEDERELVPRTESRATISFLLKRRLQGQGWGSIYEDGCPGDEVIDAEIVVNRDGDVAAVNGWDVGCVAASVDAEIVGNGDVSAVNGVDVGDVADVMEWMWGDRDDWDVVADIGVDVGDMADDNGGNMGDVVADKDVRDMAAVNGGNVGVVAAENDVSGPADKETGSDRGKMYLTRVKEGWLRKL